MVEQDIQHWVDLPDYDFDTAEAMLQAARYLYVLFCCQQAIEKRLKGLLIKLTGAMPPRTHDLLRLVGLARLPLEEEQEMFLRRLSNYYLEARYPEEMRDLARGATRELATRYFEGTREVLTWLDSQLK